MAISLDWSQNDTVMQNISNQPALASQNLAKHDPQSDTAT